MEGLKLPVLNTENFVSTFGFAISLKILEPWSFYNIYSLLEFVSTSGQIQWSNVRASMFLFENLKIFTMKKNDFINTIKEEVAKAHGYEPIIGNRWQYAMMCTYRTKRQLLLYEEVISTITDLKILNVEENRATARRSE